MKFSKLVGPNHFVVINPEIPMPVLFIDGEGRVRNLRGQALEDNAQITDDTEVQPLSTPNPSSVVRKHGVIIRS